MYEFFFFFKRFAFLLTTICFLGFSVGKIFSFVSTIGFLKYFELSITTDFDFGIPDI